MLDLNYFLIWFLLILVLILFNILSFSRQGFLSKFASGLILYGKEKKLYEEESVKTEIVPKWANIITNLEVPKR